MDKGFIEQTAKDYDMPINEVEKIASLFPDTFYIELENYITQRANN